MPSAFCDQIFEREGQPVTTGNDQPFLLAGDDVWLVAAGHVDVFAVPVERGRPVGSRSHLFRVETGRPLFGVTADDGRPVGLLAVGTGDTRLRRLPRARLHEAARDAASAPHVGELLDDWVDALCTALTRDALSESIRELRPDDVFAADRVERLRPSDRVAWVSQEDGESRFLGRAADASLGSGAVVPLSNRGWLEVQPGSRLRLHSTTDALDGEGAWEGLDRLHRIVVDYATELRAEELSRARNRLEQKVATARVAYDGAWSRLAAILSPRDLSPHLHAAAPGAGRATRDADGEALIEATRLVGEALGVKIHVPPPSAHDVGPDALLGGVARASRIRTRHVTLRDAWWTEDAGPILGFLRDTRRAVALVPTRRRVGYVLLDPTNKEELPVDEAVAARLDPWAYSLYRPFPASPLSVRELVQFGRRGIGRDLAVVVGLGVAAGLLSLLTPIMTAAIFNDIIPGADRVALVQAMLLLVTFAVTAMLLKFAGDVALLRADSRVGAAMMAAMWDRLLALPVPFFRQFSAGGLASRASALEQARNIVSGTTIGALLGGLFSAFHLGLLLYYSPRLAMVAIGLLAVAVAVSAACGVAQMKSQRVIATSQSALSGTVLQLLSSISKLRMAGAEVHAFSIWAKEFSRQRAMQFRVRVVSDVLLTFNTVFPLAASLALYVAALPLLGARGGLRTGDFVAFMTSFTLALTGILAATSALLSVMTAVPYYEQAKPILLATPEVDVAKADPGVLAGRIELHNLVFRYNAETPPVLNNVSLTFPAGEFIALVGPSGTGKSTIFRLLLGFETPASGAIYYDGQDLAGLDVRAVRSQIGVVLQQAQIIPGDVYTNIVGSASASIEEAWEAARMAGFDEDIEHMPMGMHTVVGEGSGGMSGGQRQRLMIARALVRKPRMLFLDEATSALDNRTQALVSDSLARLRVTRVVIAHRLSTIEQADRIYVLNRGLVEQVGTFADLLRAPGLFSELARRQLA